ncbi:CD209 antigen-like protein E isoform X2 [Nothobranchius furzeri]|uniref:Transcript variant X2 n=1 Tax=Nothobranchius furzeri TaxID=105023 RepID=A0A9D3BVB3_NOTFU|nr:CD209 antigen-like protein E isoform X2 [Nothobranchius furzeri]KAF7223852.1 transcript variant X2 [Nothobranchius furzeri]
MVRAVHREQTEISLDYVNEPDASNRQCSGQKLVKVVAVSFGLLCVIQATLNVYLRVLLYAPAENKHRNLTDWCYNTSRVTFNVKIYEYFKQGWVYFHPSLYYISTTNKTWEESREDCLQKQADLMIINTKEEQNFARHFDKLTWIGLYNDTGEWTWVDGTQLSESYWGPGEPNQLGGNNEDCVEMRFHEIEDSWNDAPCSNVNFWICEKDAALELE